MMSIFNLTNTMMDNVMHNTQFPLLYYVTNGDST